MVLIRGRILSNVASSDQNLGLLASSDLYSYRDQWLG